MSLRKERHIPELYDIKHRADKLTNEPFDVENNIIKKSASGHIFENDHVNDFLIRFQKLAYMLVDQMFIMKNFKNYMVDKYYDDHID